MLDLIVFYVAMFGCHLSEACSTLIRERKGVGQRGGERRGEEGKGRTGKREGREKPNQDVLYGKGVYFQ